MAANEEDEAAQIHSPAAARRAPSARASNSAWAWLPARDL